MRASPLLVLLVACGGGESPIETATVSALRSPCTSLVPTLCLDLTFADGTTGKTFEGITGYEHAWGVETEIQLERVRRDPVPADASEFELVLVDLISLRQAVDGPFDLAFPAQSGGGWIFPETRTLADATPITCEGEVCGELDAIDPAAAITATFELTDETNTLRLLDLR